MGDFEADEVRRLLTAKQEIFRREGYMAEMLIRKYSIDQNRYTYDVDAGEFVEKDGE